MTRPNLLFLYTDEQRPDTLRAYGNPVIYTPALDHLADTGTVFERTYVTQPVCTPSRASLLTGLWPHACGCVRNNVPLPDETLCLPQMLPSCRYSTAHHGKWHLGDEIFAQHGFAEWMATEDTYHDWYKPHRDQHERSAYDRFLRSQGLAPVPVSIPERPPWIADRFFREQIHHLPEEFSRETFLANTACRFLRQHRDRPFALFVNFLEPHPPIHSCRDRQYDAGLVPPPANGAPPAGDHSLRARLWAAHHRWQVGSDARLAQHWKEMTARYWGMCSLVDTAVGRILETLQHLELDRNTMVVFTSDHGDLLGSHGLDGKGFMYEESARVPCIVRLPGQRTGRRIGGLFSHIDLVPTILDCLGVEPPAFLPGRSRRTSLESGAALTDDVFLEWFPQSLPRNPAPALPEALAELASADEAQASELQQIRTVVTADGWKYNQSSIGEDELFDLGQDPGELTNLAQRPEQALRVAGMQNRIDDWRKRTGAPGLLDG